MIDFLRYRLVCGIFSIALLMSFFGIYTYRYTTYGHGFTFSVDFTGGTQVHLKFKDPIGSDTLKAILEKNEWAGATIREFSPHESLIRIKGFESDITGLASRIKDAILQEIPENEVTIMQIDSVGPGIGEALRSKSIYMILLALLIMLLYVGWRFWSFSFGIGAIVSLFHDAFIILLCFLLLDKEISINVIGAILAVLGYSINDTIVIFSRIRDNIRGMAHESLDTIVNISLNQTIKRTLLTSISTALVVISLLVLGGETLRDLSLALLIGIIFGTYSSIYIASPVMLLLYGKAKHL